MALHVDFPIKDAGVRYLVNEVSNCCLKPNARVCIGAFPRDLQDLCGRFFPLHGRASCVVERAAVNVQGMFSLLRRGSFHLFHISSSAYNDDYASYCTSCCCVLRGQAVLFSLVFSGKGFVRACVVFLVVGDFL